MLYSGTLYRAELYNDNIYPYTSVKSVYAANKGRYPGKKLIVTNGHWYSGTKPCGNYKINGKVLSQEWNCSLGFGWRNGKPITMDWSDMTACDNFIGTIPIIHNGAVLQNEIDLNKNTSVGRPCLRTWWGFDKSGACTIEVTTKNYTIQQIADRMLSLGIHNGLVLDGSGSSQCYDGETYQHGDGRQLYGFVLLWFECETQTTPTKAECPYAEPKYNIAYGSSGEGAKWLQWMLNQHGANLDVDGIIGSLSTSAINAFQRKAFPNNPGEWDSVCGAKTRTALNAIEAVQG